MDKKNIKIFLNNFSSLSINQFVNVLVAVIGTPIIFQTLGDSNYGFVRLAFSIAIILSIIVSYGYHLNGPQKISLLTSLKSKQNLINEILTIRLFLSIIVAVIVSLIILTTNIFDGYKLVLFFSLVLLFGEALNPIFYLQGINNISVFALVNGVSKLSYILFIILFIKNPNDSYLVNLLFGGSMLIVNLFYWVNFFYKNRCLIKFRFPFISVIKSRLNENFEFFSSSVAGHISIHGSLLVLENFVTQSEIGQFALAHRIGFFFRKIPIFIVQSVLQKATYENINKNFNLSEFLNYFYKRGILLSLLTAFIVSFFSKYIIFYLAGKNILYSQQILIILSFIPLFATLNIKNLVLILVFEKKKVLNKSTWISTFFMIFISIILTFFFGGIGLAFALLISEFISFLVHSFFLSKSNDSK